jgi:diguanylate cyclase (GGDEF)-like protein
MAIPVIVLGIATGALLRARQQTTEALDAERNAVAVRDSLDKILVDLTDAETGSRGYVLTGEPSFLEPYTHGAEALHGDLQTLTGLIGGDRAAEAEIAELRVLANQRLSLLQTIQLLAPVSGLTNHSQLVSEMVANAESEAASLLRQRERGLDASRRVSFLVGVIGMPLGVLASLIVVMLFVQHLAGRIVRTQEIGRMMEAGLPLREPSTSEDELGRLERVLVQSGTRVGELQGELRRMGTTDTLTRLMNRRGFLPTAEHQLKVANRTHQSVALMFLDLDGLKLVNDALGHSVGDSMITEAAFVLRETFRSSDLIGRMGGDEFCVLFAADSYHAAKIALTRLKNAVDVANAQEGRPFVLSFSAGVAFYDPEVPRTLDDLIAEADEQMYVRKRAKHPDLGTAAVVS